MRHRPLVIFCGFLIAMSAISTDILLPAVFDIARILDAPIASAQAVIPIFLLTAGAGQLLFGPASDRFGRRPVLIAGLVLYVVAAVAAALATSIEVVLCARAVQGLGGAAGVAVGRAALRDLHCGASLAQAMALATSLVALGPVLAPLAGMTLLGLGSWRAIFVAMIAIGVTLLAIALTLLPETNLAPDPSALGRAALSKNFRRVFANRQSRFFLLVAALCGFLIVCFLTHVPRLLRAEFGVESGGLVALFAVMGVAIVVGQVGNRIIIRKLGVVSSARLGATVLAVVTLSILLLHLAGWLSIWVFGALMVAFNTSYLVVMANALSLAIDPHKEIAGLVASLYGFLTMVVPGVLVMATLPLIDGRMLPWSISMMVVAGTVMLALVGHAPPIHDAASARRTDAEPPVSSAAPN